MLGVSLPRLSVACEDCCPFYLWASCLAAMWPVVCMIKRAPELMVVAALAADGVRFRCMLAPAMRCSAPAIERLSSGVFSEVTVTNTIPVEPEDVFPQLTILSVANLLGETVWRVYNASRVQALRD